MTKFVKGRSGNPKGKPPGTLARSTKLMQSVEADIPAILQSVVELARNGDMQAARIILERAIPARKASAEPLVMLGVEQAETLTDKAHALMQAIARGEVAPDVGGQLLAALGNVAKAIEIDELDRRLSALEEVRTE